MAATSEIICMGCMGAKTAGICANPSCGWVEGTPAYSLLQMPPRTTLFDRYMLGRALGQGAVGVTYLAWDLQDERRVVIKEYFPAYLATRSSDQLTLTCVARQHWASFNLGLETFQAEARDLKRLSGHSGFVSVLRVFEANGTAYMVMDYIDGQSLGQPIKTNASTVQFNNLLHVLRPAVECLSELHRFGVFHWDINPNHILFCSGHDSRLIDFGRTRRTLWVEGVTIPVKNLEFAAPEQFGASPIGGPSADVYGLGATIYFALTGRKPPSAVERMSGSELTKPRTFGIDIPYGPEDAIIRALSIAPTERHSTIEALWADLNAEVEMTRSTITTVPRHAVRMFLCHSSKDKPRIRQLYQRLRADGMDPWLDEEELVAGQDWESEIKKAVWDADLVVVCLSRQSLDVKGYVNREIQFVLDAASQQPPGELFLIPARLDEVDIPDSLRRWHWVNLYDAGGYDRLMRSAQRKSQGAG